MPKDMIDLFISFAVSTQSMSHVRSSPCAGGNASNCSKLNTWPNKSEAGDFDKSGRPLALRTPSRYLWNWVAVGLHILLEMRGRARAI